MDKPILRESRSIQARIEVERFKGRTLFRLYKTAKDAKYLELALRLSEESLNLFAVLGATMGEINARRQYAHYLLEKKLVLESGEEIEKLIRLVSTVPDRLSLTKVNYLASLYFFRTGKYVRFLKSVIDTSFYSVRLFEGRSIFSNIVESIRWFRKFLRGVAG